MIIALTACSACKSKGATEVEEPSPEPSDPVAIPQEPAPAEVAQGRSQYLLGHYPEAVEILQPVYEELKGPEQYRYASGLAGGWLALALARDVVENAEDPASHALAMSKEVDKPDLTTVANMSHGAYLLGLEDFDTALHEFEAAAAAQESPTSDSVLAHIFRAEALIGRAYGGGGSMDLKKPEDLEAAMQAYERAIEIAGMTEDDTILQARAKEGLAAVAKYRGDRKEVCEHASAAAEQYETAGASDYLQEGPKMLLQQIGCEQ